MGLAGAFVSLADDESSLQSNPAGLAKLRGVALSGSQLIGLLGTQASYLSLASSLGGKAVVGVQAAYLYDTDTLRDAFGNESGTFMSSNLLAGLGLGFAPMPGWQLGLGVKGLNEDYAGAQSTRLAGDLGVQGPLWRSLRFGAAAQNLGPAGTPLRLQGGVNFPFFTQDWRFALEAQALPGESAGRILFGSELKLSLDDLDSSRGEARPLRLALRAGAASAMGGFEPSRASLGAGLELPPTYALDYAFSSLGELGGAHRMSLALRFPGAKLPAPPGAALSAPFNLKVTELLDGIELSWEDANERVEGYNLYADFGISVDRLNAKPVTARRQKFKNVERGLAYKFSVRALGSDAKEGPASETLLFKAP